MAAATCGDVMGNSTNSAQKPSTTNANGGSPAWANVGSDAYKQQNNLLQTAPIAAANQTIAQGGQGAATQDAIKKFQGGMGQIDPSAYQGLLGQAGQGGAASQYLTGFARGDNLNGSPELQNIIDQSNRKVSDNVNAMFASGGRYGSGANQGVMADSIAQNTSNLLYNNYNQQQQNQMNAANALESAQQGRMGLGLNAAGGLAGVQGQNISGNRSDAMNAAGLENQGFGNLMSMIGALPNIQNNKTFDANQQMGLGNKLDQASQGQLNDLINQWGQNDMQDWARLGGLLSAGTQSAGNWGTQNTTTQQPMNLLGGLATLFSGFKFSDARLKEDIRRIGSTDAGTPVYTYRYKGDSTYHMGVMAQDIAEDQPEAVGMHPGGFMMVNYRKVK